MKDEITHILETASFADADARAECEFRLRGLLANMNAAKIQLAYATEALIKAERQRDEAGARGAEAMRGACALHIYHHSSVPLKPSVAMALADELRSLPIPEQEVK